MNGELSYTRNKPMNVESKPLGQHKRGSQTAPRNNLASIVKQNEEKNSKTHKENKPISTLLTSNGEPNSDQDSFKKLLDDRALQTVNQNLNSLSLKSKITSLKSESNECLKPSQENTKLNGLHSSLESLKVDKTYSISGVNSKKMDVEKQNTETILPESNPEHSSRAIDENGNAEKETMAPKFNESNVKHPLEHAWTFWYFKLDRSKAWEDNLIELADVSTIEDFWAVYNHIEVVSKLATGCDYALFKKGINPTWEDKENEKGGRWLLTLNSSQRSNGLDYYWTEMLMFLIGGEIETDVINGVVANIRNKGDKISLWLSTSSRTEERKIIDIGKQLKARLSLPQNTRINFEIHKECQNKRGSQSKCTYTV